MKGELIFDLDGVIRDLYSTTFGYMPPTWEHKISGIGLVEYIDANISLLYNAPTTRFFESIKGIASKSPITIWTHQPENWIQITLDWIYNKLGKALVKEIRLFSSFEEKENALYESSDTYIVEDYPYYSDYSKIILIQYPYNSNVINAFAKVNSIEGLEGYLSKFWEVK